MQHNDASNEFRSALEISHCLAHQYLMKYLADDKQTFTKVFSQCLSLILQFLNSPKKTSVVPLSLLRDTSSKYWSIIEFMYFM